ncbi:hypothetical protein EJ110_NYTH22254 [Nymphaea thermarum]|nr:hypothetical protein EJ110_NYTH22254 [Nymphaea thermarum]
MLPNKRFLRQSGARASAVNSQESSSDFVKRMEQAWLISQIVNHLATATKASSLQYLQLKGVCGMQMVWRNWFLHSWGQHALSSAVKEHQLRYLCRKGDTGSGCCSSCKGTGFRAKWLEQTTSSNP